MIWSVDQDDAQYTAMQALYPGQYAATGKISGGGTCGLSDCDMEACDSGGRYETLSAP